MPVIQCMIASIIKILIDILNIALGDQTLPTLWKILTTAKLLRPSKQLK